MRLSVAWPVLFVGTAVDVFGAVILDVAQRQLATHGHHHRDAEDLGRGREISEDVWSDHVREDRRPSDPASGIFSDSA